MRPNRRPEKFLSPVSRTHSIQRGGRYASTSLNHLVVLGLGYIRLGSTGQSGGSPDTAREYTLHVSTIDFQGIALLGISRSLHNDIDTLDFSFLCDMRLIPDSLGFVLTVVHF